MRGKLVKKGMVLEIIVLFVGASVVLSIGGSIEIASKDPNEKDIHIANNKGPSVDRWYIVDTVGWWHFNECTGDLAIDSSGHGNHGGIHDTKWTTDTPPGGGPCALHFFADKNSYVGVPDDPSLDFDDLGEDEGFMIDFWMAKNQTPSPNYAGLVCKQFQGGYRVNLGENNKIYFTIIYDPHTSQDIISITTIDDNEWHHIVAVWDGAWLYLYIDDMTSPDNSTYVGEFTIGDTSKWLDIGNDWPTDNENPFDGKIDEVRISIIEEDYIPPECSIVKPGEGYRYLNNKQIGKYRSIIGWTLVIGPRSGIMIEVKAKDEQSGIDRVEFKINDELYWKNYEPNPSTNYYEFTWIETRFGICSLEAIAWDKAGYSTSSGILNVLYFNIE